MAWHRERPAQQPAGEHCEQLIKRNDKWTDRDVGEAPSRGAWRIPTPGTVLYGTYANELIDTATTA